MKLVVRYVVVAGVLLLASIACLVVMVRVQHNRTTAGSGRVDAEAGQGHSLPELRVLPLQEHMAVLSCPHGFEFDRQDSSCRACASGFFTLHPFQSNCIPLLTCSDIAQDITTYQHLQNGGVKTLFRFAQEIKNIPLPKTKRDAGETDRQTDTDREMRTSTHTHSLSLFLSFFLSFFRTNARQLSRAEWETDSGDLVPVVVAQPHTQSIADFQMGIQNLASLSDNPFVVKPIGMCQQPPTLITPVRALWFFVLFCFLIF